MLFSKFQSILSTNNEALELIADMGDKLGGDYVFDRQYIVSAYQRLSDLVHELIFDLNTLAPKKYVELFKVFERIDFHLQREIAGKWVLPRGDEIIPYGSLTQDLNEEVGNKNANLAEMKNVLGLPIPDGFAITTAAFRAFLEWNGLFDKIQDMLRPWAEDGEKENDEISAAIRGLILNAAIPPAVDRQAAAAVERLRQKGRGSEVMFAVRSSAWGEDSEHSFAGQYKTILNVPPNRVLDCYKEILAGAYSSFAIEYRREKGFQAHETAMAAACQVMIDAAVSGVAYTVDPYVPEGDRMVVTATYGLGAPLVEGEVQADQYVVGRTPPHSLLSLKIVRKPTMLVLKSDGGTESHEVPDELQSMSCLNPEQLQKLAEMALLIERYFKRPQDIEWVLDRNSDLIILQARPLNIRKQPDRTTVDISSATAGYPVIMSGKGVVVQRGVATGRVFIVEKDSDLTKCPSGAILVTRYTSPRLARVMRKVHGILTDVGSATGHMATIAREFRVPTVVNTRIATTVLKTGDEITMDATQNIVYSGRVRELSYYEFTEEDVFEESYEYRLLRRILKKISPLHLVDPHDRNFTPSGCLTVHDIIRFIHEKAVEELIHLEHARLQDADKAAKRLNFSIPLRLVVINVGGGLEEGSEGPEVTPAQIASIPMRAFLDGLTAPGMWGREPVPVDFGSFMSSLTRTFPSSLASPEYLGKNLAVVSREYFDLGLRLGYHFNIIDAYISDNLNDNYAYFRFLGGVTDMIRRSRRARFIAEVLERFHFRVEVRGDLVVGRIKKLERSHMEEKMWLIGCLVAYTRQLDVKMQSDERVEQFVDDFFQKVAGLHGEGPPPNSVELGSPLPLGEG